MVAVSPKEKAGLGLGFFCLEGPNYSANILVKSQDKLSHMREHTYIHTYKPYILILEYIIIYKYIVYKTINYI